MGVTVALISLFMIVFLFVVTSIFDAGGSYIGLVIYILLPGVMIFGLILIPIGMIKARKIREMEAVWPKVDLNIKTHRNAFFIFAIGTTLLLFFSLPSKPFLQHPVHKDVPATYLPQQDPLRGIIQKPVIAPRRKVAPPDQSA